MNNNSSKEQNKMKKLVSKEFVIGISVIAALVVLFFGIDYLKGVNLMNPTNYYYVSYSNVSGLESSAPVSINGYKVGQVRELTYDYEHPGKIKVLIAVNDKLRIPEDSYAEMASTLLSGGYINIVMGKSNKTLEKGSEIASREQSDLMSSVTNDMLPAVNSILPKVDSLVYNLNTLVADPSLRIAIRNLEGITNNLLYTSKGLDNTMRRDVPLFMRSATGVTTKLDSVSYNLMALSHTLKELPLAETMDNVQAVTVNLEKFSNQLNEQNSTLGKLTNDPELYNRLNRVSADIDSLILDIKKNPKRYISIKLF